MLATTSIIQNKTYGIFVSSTKCEMLFIHTVLMHIRDVTHNTHINYFKGGFSWDVWLLCHHVAVLACQSTASTSGGRGLLDWAPIEYHTNTSPENNTSGLITVHLEIIWRRALLNQVEIEAIWSHFNKSFNPQLSEALIYNIKWTNQTQDTLL